MRLPWSARRSCPTYRARGSCNATFSESAHCVSCLENIPRISPALLGGVGWGAHLVRRAHLQRREDQPDHGVCLSTLRNESHAKKMCAQMCVRMCESRLGILYSETLVAKPYRNKHRNEYRIRDGYSSQTFSTAIAEVLNAPRKLSKSPPHATSHNGSWRVALPYIRPYLSALA